MELLKQPPTTKAPAQMFTGDVWFDVIHRGDIIYTPPGEEY